ncbi:MAG: MFS transporter [Meiothermus sp.]|nr:MFS transporter [Meiothermus sp.]
MSGPPPIPPSVRRNTLLLAMVQAINGAGIQLVPTFGAIQVVTLLGSAVFAGLATSLMGLSRALTAYSIGRFSDLWGRKPTLYLGLWLTLMGALLIGGATLAGSLALFALGILVFGTGVGAVQQMRVAAADMYPPSRRGEGLSLVAMGSLLGAGLSPMLVTLAEWLGRRLGFSEIALAWLLVPLLVLPGFLMVRGIRPDPKRIAQHLEAYYRPEDLQTGPDSTPRGERQVQPRIAALSSAVAAQGQMVMMMAMTALALKALECSLAQISLSVALHVMGMFAFSWPIGRLADRIGRKPVMGGGLAVAALGALLVGLGQGYGAITAGTFLVGLGWSGAFLAANTALADVTPPAERGRATGVLEAWANLSGMILPILGGLVVETLGLPTLGYFGALLALLPLPLVYRLREVAPGVFQP